MKRKRLSIDNLVVMTWPSLAEHGDQYTTRVFDSLYVQNATNFNFLYQKKLVSDIGTKGIVPHDTSYDTWAQASYTVFEKRLDKEKKEYLYPIAVATICDIDLINRVGEIKFVIKPSLYGKGYTRLVASMIINVAFQHMLLNNVLIKVLKDKSAYKTTNSLLKIPGCRKVGVIFSVIEADKQLRSVYLFQCSEEFHRRAKEEKDKK